MSTEFTLTDGLAWLGVSLEDYRAAQTLTEGVHGSPMISALMDAQRVHNGLLNATPAQVLAEHGIENPRNLTPAYREFLSGRAKFWSAS